MHEIIGGYLVALHTTVHHGKVEGDGIYDQPQQLIYFLQGFLGGFSSTVSHSMKNKSSTGGGFHKPQRSL